MTSAKAKSIGAKQLFKGGLILFAGFELLLLLLEIRGDMANGILFFIEGQLNLVVLILLVVFLTIMTLLGRQAGVTILVNSKSYYSAALFYGLLTSTILVLIDALIMRFFRSYDYYFSNVEIVKRSARHFAVLLLPVLLVWRWAAKKIKAKEKRIS